jgi:dTDP-4-dehydrorhamnose reductase
VLEGTRVLLLGASGQLGSAIRQGWRGLHIASPSHAALDVTDPEALAAAIRETSPSIVVNCAAFHNVERCETDAQSAFAANALAVNALAEICAQRDCTFVTISTDYVFDGTLGSAYTEDDAPRPLNVYAASKYAGELLALRLQSKAYVVRTCGVYAVGGSTSKGHTFVERILAQARAGETVRVVRDQTVSPTYAPHLAAGLLQLLRSGAPYGLYHMVNDGAVTWYDFAAQALQLAGIRHPIDPISYKDWNSRVRRPEYSALQNARLREQGISMPSTREGLQAYLRDAPK